jgi:hypothetical protein
MIKAKIINPTTNKSVRRFGELFIKTSSVGVGVGSVISAGALYKKVNVPEVAG